MGFGVSGFRAFTAFRGLGFMGAKYTAEKRSTL